MQTLVAAKVPAVEICRDIFAHSTYYSPDALMRDVPEFAQPSSAEIWLPYDLPVAMWTNVVGARNVNNYARLAPGQGLVEREVARDPRIGGDVSVRVRIECLGGNTATSCSGAIPPINIASATFMVAMGTSLAGSIRVGQHVGAGSRRGVHRAVLTTYAVVVAFMAVCALAFLILPRWLLGLYTGDPRIVEVGMGLMVMAAAFQVFDGAQVAGLCALRGAGDTRVPMWITILGYWVIGAPVAYLLGFRAGWGGPGIWAGLVVSLGIVSILLAWRARRVLWDRPLVRL